MDNSETYYDKLINKLKNNRLITYLLILAIVTASILEILKKIQELNSNNGVSESNSKTKEEKYKIEQINGDLVNGDKTINIYQNTTKSTSTQLNEVKNIKNYLTLIFNEDEKELIDSKILVNGTSITPINSGMVTKKIKIPKLNKTYVFEFYYQDRLICSKTQHIDNNDEKLPITLSDCDN